jgi:hypothetical protein
MQLHSTLTRFDGVGTNTLLRILHDYVEQDKGKELILGAFRSPPLVNVKDVKVSPLHVIFDLKRVLVGRDYFRINHFLPPLFSLVQGPTLLGKNIISMPTLKEFLLNCSEQFTIYIWMFTPLAKMNAYLRKTVEEMGIKIEPQRIMGQDLCKINEHFLQFPIKVGHYSVDCLTYDRLIYH